MPNSYTPRRVARGIWQRGRSAQRRGRIALAERAASLVRDDVRRQRVREQLWPHRRQPVLTAPTIDRLAALKDAERGRRCFIIGTAPSIDHVDLSRIRHDFVFLVNKGYLLTQRFTNKPDAIMIANPHAAAEYGDEAFDYEFRYKFLSAAIPAYNKQYEKEIIVFNQWETPGLHNHFFQFDCTKPLYHANTVVLSALQMAVWLGFAEIVFAGVDLDFYPSQPHFYQTEGNEYERSLSVSAQMMPRMLEGFNASSILISLFADAKLYNTSRTSRLNCIPFIEWNDLLSQSA